MDDAVLFLECFVIIVKHSSVTVTLDQTCRVLDFASPVERFLVFPLDNSCDGLFAVLGLLLVSVSALTGQNGALPVVFQ